LRVILAIIYLA